MSFPKKDRKIRSVSGKVFPDAARSHAKTGTYSFSATIATALRRAYGPTHAAVKSVVACTGANERAAKNWLDGRNGPSGEHLIELLRHSDEVLEAVLRLAGRERILTAKRLADARDKLVEMVALLAALDEPEPDGRPPLR